MSFILETDPNALKKLKKKLQKESKAEHTHVKHAIKDLAKLEKSEKKALKALDKAEHNIIKAEKSESATADAMNKARHNHDVAVANVSTANKDFEIKKQRESMIKSELEAKKVQVEQMVNSEQSHNQERESKLAKIHAARAGETPPQSARPSSFETNSVAASPVSATANAAGA